LIRRIGSLQNVDVKPLSSVIRYGALEQDPIAAGRDLEVDIVVDGAVQASKDRVRVSVRPLN
jgi:TolB-like protein